MWDMNRPWHCKIVSLHSSSADVNNNLLLQVIHAWLVRKKWKFICTRLIPICMLQQFSRIIHFLFCSQSQSRILWEHPEQYDKLCACLAGQHVWFLLEEEAVGFLKWMVFKEGLAFTKPPSALAVELLSQSCCLFHLVHSAKREEVSEVPSAYAINDSGILDQYVWPGNQCVLLKVFLP